MFKTGDTVLYGNEGVCRITEITEKQFMDRMVEYFVLQPVFDKRSTFFVPTGNEQLLARMHPVLNINQLTETICKSMEFDSWIDNDSQRREYFRDILLKGEISEIVSLTKTLMHHKEKIESEGKKLHKADESAFKEAQKILYEEFSLVSNVEKDDVVNILSGKGNILEFKK